VSRKGSARQQNNLFFFKDSKKCIGCPETFTLLDDSRFDRFSHVSRTFPDYKRRAGIEGTMSQAAFAFGMRRTRYRGLQKTHLHHLATAMAINLQRFVNWLWDIPRVKTRQSHFARLALAT
jgi:hypothetical protein